MPKLFLFSLSENMNFGKEVILSRFIGKTIRKMLFSIACNFIDLSWMSRAEPFLAFTSKTVIGLVS